jgi:CO/xanthine dehydrogenase FAD-binding subunit
LTNGVYYTYMKVFQKASGFTTVAVAARVRLAADGRIGQTARVGITMVVAKSLRAKGVEHVLEGQVIDEAAITTITTAAEQASAGIEALSNLQASGEYRLALVQV